MGVHQRITCDRCGTLIEAGRTVLRAECGPHRDRFPTFDICVSCCEDLIAWFSAIHTTQEAHANVGQNNV